MTTELDTINTTEENALENRQRTVFDYLAEETATFKEKPFCVEDSILFTQLAYLRLGNYVRNLRRFTLSVPLRRLAQPDIMAEITDSLGEAENLRRLLTLAAQSRRFGRVRVKFFEEHTDLEIKKQFCAVTFLLDSKNAFVAYRGTDNTIVGWRENFNMAFMTPVPSQSASAEYLRSVAAFLPFRSLYVGGHSKGGNLAVYASLYCGSDLQQRIGSVYNLDGPGFKENMLHRNELRGIKDKLHIVLPQSSMVGTLLKSGGERKIVRSTGKGFEQHNPTRWFFDGMTLSYIPSLSKDAIMFDEIVDRWLDSLTNKQRELIVDVMFDVINQSKSVTFDQVIDKIKTGEISAFRVLKELDADTRKQMLPLLKGLGVEYLKARMPFGKE